MFQIRTRSYTFRLVSLMVTSCFYPQLISKKSSCTFCLSFPPHICPVCLHILHISLPSLLHMLGQHAAGLPDDAGLSHADLHFDMPVLGDKKQMDHFLLNYMNIYFLSTQRQNEWKKRKLTLIIQHFRVILNLKH